MTKIALVIGATGLIGRALVDELLAQDTIGKVITLTRSPLELGQAPAGLGEKFENHIIDFSNLANYSELFKQVDMLFSCLGTTKKAAGTIERQRVIDVDYQYDAANIARESGVEEYYLVSSSGASASSLSPYLKMKGELEDKVIALSFDRCVIFRPSLLIGERADRRPGEFFAGKVMPLLSCIPILNKYRPIKGSEVAQKMARVAVKYDKAGFIKKSKVVNSNVEYFSLDQVFI